MFIRYFVELPMPLEDAEASLRRSPETWIPGLARDASGRGEGLLAELGFSVGGPRVRKRVEIELGAPQQFPSKTILPMSWRATGQSGLFPALEADLEVAALGPHRTQLSVSARYRPPFGAVGRAVDRSVLHRVAEATMKDFVDGIGEALASRASAASSTGTNPDRISR